jgi:hypothetical protein
MDQFTDPALTSCANKAELENAGLLTIPCLSAMAGMHESIFVSPEAEPSRRVQMCLE